MDTPEERASYRARYVGIDFRARPDLYRIGRGEEGVLLAEPYKSELLPHWRFATPDLARASADTLTAMFRAYGDAGDFVGMDMARKFLQMGYTRARRYANHRGGKKYDGPVPVEKKGISGAHGRAVLPREIDPVKAESAAIFKAAWDAARADPTYHRLKAEHQARYESRPSNRSVSASAQPVSSVSSPES